MSFEVEIETGEPKVLGVNSQFSGLLDVQISPDPVGPRTVGNGPPSYPSVDDLMLKWRAIDLPD